MIRALDVSGGGRLNEATRMEIHLDKRAVKQIRLSAADAVEEGDTEALREDVLEAFSEEQVEEIERRLDSGDFFEFLTDILDEFSVYEESEKSFYVSDGPQPSFMVFQTGEALAPRAKYQLEIDMHGVVPPVDPHVIVPARRRYRSDG